MSHRPTSAEAFATIERSGRLAKRQLEVLRAFHHHGAGTSAEIHGKVCVGGNLNLWRARVTELTDMGMLQERRARKCRVTGFRAIVFQFEPGEPREKKLTYRELEHANADLASAVHAAWRLITAQRCDVVRAIGLFSEDTDAALDMLRRIIES